MRTISLLFLAFLFVAGNLSAQTLSKEEQKKWKAEAKAYRKDPAKLKSLVEERDQYKMEAQNAQGQLQAMQANMNQANMQVSQLKQENMNLTNQLMQAQQTIDNMMAANQRPPAVTEPTPPPMGGGEDYSTGTVYRVQIGAYSPGKIPSKVQSIPDVMYEEVGNLRRALIGNYRNMEDARARQSQLKRDGFSGAFIVTYRDNVRQK